MARPREFDSDQVLSDAMEAFWENGYGATSINDLLDETKLARGSLYGAFGDKRHLFLAALDEYDRRSVEEMHLALSRPGSAKRALREWVENYGVFCAGAEGRRGCLVAKAAMELAHQDRDIAEWIRKVRSRNEGMIADTIVRGQSAGEINGSRDPHAVARFLIASMAGLGLLGTSSPTEVETREVTDLMLSLLD